MPGWLAGWLADVASFRLAGLQKRALKFQSLGSKFPRALEN